MWFVISIVISIVSLIISGLYLYFIRHFNYWKEKSVSYVEPFPFFGNLKDVMLQKTDIGHLLKNVYDTHKGMPYVGIFFFDQPALLIRDLNLVKQILVKDSYEYFMDRIINMDENVDPMGNKNMFSLKGEKWRYMRAKMTPTFTSVKIKNMLHLVQTCGNELVECLKNPGSEDSSIEVKDTMARYTTDVIASCAFGIEANSLKDPEVEFRRILRSIFQFTPHKALAGLTSFFAPAIQSFLKLRLIDEDVTNFVRNTVWRTKEHREKNGLIRKDFMDSIIQTIAKSGVEEKGFQYVDVQGQKIKIDGDDFVAQAYIFLAAGFEPASTTMSFALYELSFRSDIQDKIREEISNTKSKYSDQITYQELQETTYLDMVIAETLRKYPVVPFLDRVASKDYQLASNDGTESLILKAGTAVYVPVLAIHNDPEYYPDPEIFDPERFTEENKSQRPSYTYLPFGEGPRTCIGARFGLLKVKIGLIYILSNYEVKPCSRTPTSLIFDPKPFLLATEGEIPLIFKRIER
ncbi:Cytochrome P450 6j1 [Blattella germanica]|nr:Cytochrome P450 6j1 [Blattella germanica]